MERSYNCTYLIKKRAEGKFTYSNIKIKGYFTERYWINFRMNQISRKRTLKLFAWINFQKITIPCHSIITNGIQRSHFT